MTPQRFSQDYKCITLHCKGRKEKRWGERGRKIEKKKTANTDIPFLRCEDYLGLYRWT
jgi:hypothetical protein